MPTTLFTQPPLEDRDDHAVGRADRQQVHDHGLERHEQRPEHEHQQDEAEQQDREEHVGQALARACRRGRRRSRSGSPTCTSRSVPCVASGITSSRSRCTSCGRALVLRRALRRRPGCSTPLPFGLGITGLTCATPGSCAIAVGERAPSPAMSAGECVSLATQQRAVEARARSPGSAGRRRGGS